MTENDPKNIQKQFTAKLQQLNIILIEKEEARDQKTVQRHVPDIHEDCIKNDFKQILRNQQFLNSKRNKISNQIGSQIRSVHGTMHHEKTLFTIGPNEKVIFEKTNNSSS